MNRPRLSRLMLSGFVVMSTDASFLLDSSRHC
jgi:hypothetical protein